LVYQFIEEILLVFLDILNIVQSSY
jgi:hypothetical protein